jgi:hypothetical protein
MKTAKALGLTFPTALLVRAGLGDRMSGLVARMERSVIRGGGATGWRHSRVSLRSTRATKRNEVTR